MESLIHEHPTLPLGWDDQGRFYWKPPSTGEWRQKAIRRDGNLRFRKRDLNANKLKRGYDPFLGVDLPWDEESEHEALRFVSRIFCCVCGKLRNAGEKCLGRPAIRNRPYCRRCDRSINMRRLRCKKCSQCGILFRHSTRRRFCSGECARRNNYVRQASSCVERKCITCDKVFVNRKYKSRRYCSDECRELGPTGLWPLADGACERCHEPFRRRVPRYHYAVSSRYCSSQCAKRDRDCGNQRGVRKLRASQARIYMSEVAERDNYTCHLCGKPVDMRLSSPDPLCASIDHVVPLSKGGEHDLSNMRLAHLQCNVSKGNRDAGTTTYSEAAS